VYLLVFHTYINEMHGSRSEIPSKKNLLRQRCTEGFNFSVKELKEFYCSKFGDNMTNHCHGGGTG
jgi:hypothetical protein